jgi:hypothetical protein
MKALIAAVMCAWLALALAAPADSPSTAGVAAAPVVETPDIDQRIREITGEADEPQRAHGRYLDLMLALTIVVALLILASGLDDAFIDVCYWGGRLRLRRRASASPGLEEILGKPEALFAIMVPAWKESEVIAAMIENTLATLDYREYRIFCGVYPNDPATRLEVDRMAARHPGRVIRVDVPHDGPTCKADCLNAIVRRLLAVEQATGRRFAGMVLHDSEDVIHPLELKLFNSLLPGRALVQLPVFSLERAWTEFTAGTYIDDFAESHGKDIHVRQALVGIVPGAGVATCYSRECIATLSQRSRGEPFNTASLTEDYDLSFRLKELGMAQAFAHVRLPAGAPAPGVRGRTATIVSTHEYFPDRFKAAYRQRARWVLGIAFQGWRQLRWKGSLAERYFLFRDRKAMVMAPACAAAYFLLANFVLGMMFGPPEWRLALQWMLALPLLKHVLALNLAFMANRALQRMIFVGRYYGARQAALSLVRMPVNNLINFCAVMRAWRLFAVHLATGRKLAWDKTAHVYPDAHLLAQPVAKAAAALLLCLGLALSVDESRAAPPELTGQAYELADQAYKALERDQPDRALALASSALELAPGHARLLLIQAEALGKLGRNAEAVQRVAGLSAADLGGSGLAQRGYLRLAAGDNAGGEADLRAALGSGELDASERGNVEKDLAALAAPQDTPQETNSGDDDSADRGYRSLEAGNDAAAVGYFGQALSTMPAGAPRGGLNADAGYAAMRLGRNREAVSFFSGAIDDWHASPPGSKPFDENALYELRRSVSSLERRWGGSFSIGHNTTSALAGSGVTSGNADLRVLQAGAELFYTPQSFGYRDGRVFQWYANAFQALSTNDADYPTGSDSRVASLGARYKPLRETNLVVGFERRFSSERAGEDDWVAHAGWSASRATDWDPTRSSWTTWQVYTESFYFIEAARLIQPFEARVGRSFKMAAAPSLVLTPYIGVAGDYDRALDPSFAAGAGPGVALRYWFGETRYRAFARYLDLSVQYRFGLTDAERASGLFFLGTLSF